MYYVCAIIKNEHDYIREWVLHNRSIGFDQVVLYDNDSSAPYDGVLSDFIREGFVTIKSWPGSEPRRQISAYEDFARSQTWQRDDWCAFIDPDEYIFFDEDKNIAEFLCRYSDCAAVTLFWRCYGASGRVKSAVNFSTVEAYPIEGCWYNPGFMFKTIAKLNQAGNFYDAHRIVQSGERLTVTTSHKLVCDMNVEIDYALAHIKHYMTRSWEDYVKKLKRGNITAGLRKIDTFFCINPDMAHWREELCF